jgi:hypothetical protein
MNDDDSEKKWKNNKYCQYLIIKYRLIYFLFLSKIDQIRIRSKKYKIY